MKIGIDARFLTHPQPGGFKTYTENLVSALARVDLENEYFLYTDRAPKDQISSLNNTNFTGHVVSGEFPFVGVPWREQVGLVRRAAKDQIDLLHAPCLTAPLNLDCPLVVTIHDMIWAFPEKFSQNNAASVKRKLMEWYNRVIPRYAARSASVIITVSHAARESIAEYLQLSIDHIVVTHEAPNPLFKQIKDEQRFETVRRKYNLPANFILAIGSADPRKNISRLVQAYSLLSPELREKYQLAIVWTHSFLAHELSIQIDKLQLSNNVSFLESVSNNDLVSLYNAASLFAFPSLYEGFGLPPLEAMACGVPVVAADNSSIPEIVGDAALLFEAQDVDGMSNAMRQILIDDTLRTTLSKKGVERAASFSWDRCARETIDVYETVLRWRKN
jgi:glycosyltransferase involved in cell wall biosynthesis